MDNPAWQYCHFSTSEYGILFTILTLTSAKEYEYYCRVFITYNKTHRAFYYSILLKSKRNSIVDPIPDFSGIQLNIYPDFF